jgi:leucyl-tRNA synthetase
MPVDNYIGGIEHAILHLLYSRFWTKVLRDMGMVDVDEPFTNLLCQGMVKDENGDTMSKSKGNVVPPSSVIDPYGADTMRLAILFVAPPEKDFNWDPEAVAGANRFIKRAWRVVWLLSQSAEKGEIDPAALSGQDAELNRALHELGIKCTRDFDRGQFNTAISAVMELVNAASKYLNGVPADKRNKALCWRVSHDVVAMLAPICPHWAEELFHEALGLDGSVYNEPWPEFDAEQAKSDTIEIAVQIKGKVRARINVAADASKDELEAAAKKAVAAQLEGKTVRKVIVVPGSLVNIVAM